MADASVVHIGENSAEQVAYKLLKEVSLAEGKRLRGDSISAGERPDRAYILDTYAECLQTVRDSFTRVNAAKKK